MTVGLLNPPSAIPILTDDQVDGRLRQGFEQFFPQCGGALQEHLQDYDTGHVIATFQAECLSTLWAQSGDKVALSDRICRYADSLLVTGSPELRSIVRITLLHDVTELCEGFLHHVSSQIEDKNYSPELRAYVAELIQEVAEG